MLNLILSYFICQSFLSCFHVTVPGSAHVSVSLWQVPHWGAKNVCNGRRYNIWLDAPWRLSCEPTDPEKVHLFSSLCFLDFIPGFALIFFFFCMSCNFSACGSDAEAEQVFKMDNPRLSAQQNKGIIPPPLGRKQGREEAAGATATPLPRYRKRVHTLLLTRLSRADLAPDNWLLFAFLFTACIGFAAVFTTCFKRCVCVCIYI